MSALQLHLMVVHLPVLACPAAALLLIVARFARNETLFRTACATMLLGALGGAAAYLSGPAAYEALGLSAGAERDLIEAHAALGKGAFMGLILLGLAAALALLQIAQGETSPDWLRWTLLVAALLLAYLLAWTAHQGGRAGHPELREQHLPVFPELE